MKKRRSDEELLTQSLETYLKNVNQGKLVSEDALKEIVHDALKAKKSEKESYIEEKENYKKVKKRYKNLVVSGFLPLLLASTVAVSTVGGCYLLKDQIGPSYDQYYKNSYTTTIQEINDHDFKLNTTTIDGKGLHQIKKVAYDIHMQEGKDLYEVCGVSQKTSSYFMEALKQEQSIAHDISGYGRVSRGTMGEAVDGIVYTVKKEKTENHVSTSSKKEKGYDIPKKYKIAIFAGVLELFGIGGTIWKLKGNYKNPEIKEQKRRMKQSKMKLKAR